MRQTKIVGTLGPASNNEVIYRALLQAGLNVTRLNFSHGNHAEHLKNIELIKKVRQEMGIPMPILLDTKGPEIRVRTMKEGTILKNGQDFILVHGDFIGDEHKAPITYEGLYLDVQAGEQILISDGKIVLQVQEIQGEEIHTKVIHGGELKTRKGVNAPGIRVNLPAVTVQDRLDIAFGVEQGVDFIAPSFIRKAADVLEIRKILEELGAGHIQIISKIENSEGFHNLDEILQVSDGIMVARGDLGMEMPIEEVPIAQKKMIKKANSYGKTVITATQMLESMTTNPLPTRAEATDVANAILDGTDAIMLSGEMAAGAYPVESVMMMDRIARVTERELDYAKLLEQHAELPYLDSVTYAVSRSSVESAFNLNAKAILTATSSGMTAKKIAMHHPKSPIIAGTTSASVQRQLNLVRGVIAVPIREAQSIDHIFNNLEEAAKANGFVQDGDLVVITCGIPLGVSGATNLMKIHLIGELTLKGVGIGDNKVHGTVRLIQENSTFNPGDILVTQSIDEHNAHLVKKAGGLITVEGGYTSMGAIAGINFGIPTIVGVQKALELLKDGMEMTLDARLGLIYNSRKELR